MERSRDYLQGVYDSASWIQGVLTSWGEVETRRVLEQLTSNALEALESGFMEDLGVEWPDKVPRKDDFILDARRYERDGIVENAAKL
jgi:hypothetical protein